MLRRLERFYVVFGLLFFAGGLIPTRVQENDFSSRGKFDPGNFTLQLFVFLVLGTLVFIHKNEIVPKLRVSGWLISVCLLAIMSTLWSSDPLLTLRRSIILSGMTLFGLYVSARFDWDEQLDLVRWMFFVSVLGSFAMVAVLPEYGLSSGLHSGNWKGIFPHKNMLGRMMAFGILTMWFGKPKEMRWRSRGYLEFGGAVLLFLSNSMTSIFSLVLTFVFYPVLYFVRRRRKAALPIAVMLLSTILVSLLLIVTNATAILAATGRDTSLSGRIPLWSAVCGAIEARPLLGYGYAAYWSKVGVSSVDIAKDIHWTPVHAHNGYLDVGLDLGLVGVFLILCGLGSAIRRAVSLLRKGSTNNAIWPIVFLLFFAIYNLTESNILRLETFLWVPYVWTFATLAAQSCARESIQREHYSSFSYESSVRSLALEPMVAQNK